MSATAQDVPASLSTAERVRRYVDERPVVRAALAADLVNLSELTRQITDDTDLEGKHAILAACRRYQDQLDPEPYGERIREALEGARLDVRTGIEARTVDRRPAALEAVGRALDEAQGDAVFHLLDGDEAVTVVTEPGPAARLDDLHPGTVRAHRDGLVEARVTCPDEAAQPTGLVSFLTSSLTQRGADPVHVSAGQDAVAFVLDQADLTTAVGVLDPLIG